ncbi:LCP family protein [Candidatus Uhrbacteria bacterium]|nr:LCP family protein [Candidatus Uhrbacteria bacterium]
MPAPKINFLEKINSAQNPRKRGRFRNRFFLVAFFVLALTGVIMINRDAGSANKNEGRNKFSFLSGVRSLIASGDRALKGEKEGRVNILLLGIGGEGHEGQNLTDTIILASIDPKTKQVGMLSIPRDLFVPIPGYGYRRINNAYAFAEETIPGSGGRFTSEVVGDLLNLTVHYFARVDFQGFKKLVDILDGVTINVERDFTDPLYPTDDFLTQALSFRAGSQTMDGERALEYVRSRHGSNGEGSDFARSKRQQKILLAVRDKILSRGFLGSPAKLIKTWQTLSEHAETDLEPWELARLGAFARDVSPQKIAKHGLETAPDGPLVARLIDNAFVLLPASGTWDEVREIAKNIFSSPPEQKKGNLPTVEIQNGTNVPGFAAGVAELLKRSGYRVVKIGNSRTRDYEKTVIYEIKPGSESDALVKLRTMLDANVSVTLPGFYNGGSGNELAIEGGAPAGGSALPNADFLIILGSRSLAVIQ